MQVDGLMVNGLDVDGAVQSYFNSSMSQEMVYTTRGASADVAGGGVRLNMIPRDGGNKLNGSLFLGYQNKSFQTDNLTRRPEGARPEDARRHRQAVEHRRRARRPDQEGQDLVLRVGPHLRPGHAAGRHVRRHPGTALANRAPTPSSERGVDPQSISSFQARIVWQMSPKNKLSVYNDRLLKNRGAAMTAGFDPATASGRLELADLHHRLGQVHLDGRPAGSLFEGGFSTNYERYNTLYQPGIAKKRGTPEWYTAINKQDPALGHAVELPARRTRACIPIASRALAPVSYVTGTHNVKVGVQDTWGRYRRTTQRQRRHPRHLPERRGDQATILNTPVELSDQLQADLGIYGQDSAGR